MTAFYCLEMILFSIAYPLISHRAKDINDRKKDSLFQ